jgi:hypothetical protein
MFKCILSVNIFALGSNKSEWEGSETSELWAGTECKQNPHGGHNFNWTRTYWSQSLCGR